MQRRTEKSPTIKAEGPSIVRVGFDPERIAKLRPTEVSDIAYHIARVIRGEASANTAWEHWGMKVDVIPWRSKLKP
jgi:hypothetical protein